MKEEESWAQTMKKIMPVDQMGKYKTILLHLNYYFRETYDSMFIDTTNFKFMRPKRMNMKESPFLTRKGRILLNWYSV